MVLVALVFLYLTFAILLLRSRKASAGFQAKNTGQRVAFIQVALISIVNGTVCTFYVYLQYFPGLNPLFIYAATYAWVMVHGMLVIITLTVNRTIRAECWEMVTSGVGDRWIRWTGGETVSSGVAEV